MKTESKYGMKFIAPFMLVFLIVLISFAYYDLSNLSVLTLSQLSIVPVILSSYFVIIRAKEGKAPFLFVYFVVFFMFHFGFIITSALSIPIEDDFLFVYSNYWPSDKYVRQSIILANIGMLSLITGYFLNKSKINKLHSNTTIDNKSFRTNVEIIGFSILSAAVAIWFYSIASIGTASIIAASYAVFLEKTGQQPIISLLYYFIGLGFVLVVAASPGRLTKAGAVVFGLFALVGFPIGLRGEVLFPLATAAATILLNGDRVPVRKTLVVVLVILCLISGVRVLRQSGLGSYSFSFQDFLPHNALVEMGGSLRSVAEVASWAGNGESYLHGATFLAPVERALVYVVPFVERVPAEQDNRLMNVVIQNRVGTIGFSPVAEGHRNFGIFGVVLFMIATGMVLRFLEIYGQSLFGRSIAAVVMFPIVYEVRNAFVQVPFQIVFGLMIVFAVSLTCKVKSLWVQQ